MTDETDFNALDLDLYQHSVLSMFTRDVYENVALMNRYVLFGVSVGSVVVSLITGGWSEVMETIGTVIGLLLSWEVINLITLHCYYNREIVNETERALYLSVLEHPDTLNDIKNMHRTYRRYRHVQRQYANYYIDDKEVVKRMFNRNTYVPELVDKAVLREMKKGLE